VQREKGRKRDRCKRPAAGRRCEVDEEGGRKRKEGAELSLFSYNEEKGERGDLASMRDLLREERKEGKRGSVLLASPEAYVRREGKRFLPVASNHNSRTFGMKKKEKKKGKGSSRALA